ncbi:unnamed protein product [Vitrella brassicaformis CCMP3155]|uniref:Glycine cleavage system P protein n=1 Tax=Vitrella brassicaformis (strain CCMP3155) TaxID=1169540 RepID=A0A0G4EEB1_VITBC|nr:unnamed protein product [Vitrella brassicaformis CCMP3155]|eukprot:CEL93686.1 unnamed protein product [Vitrella brassicaformis CCMP3155]
MRAVASRRLAGCVCARAAKLPPSSQHRRIAVQHFSSAASSPSTSTSSSSSSSSDVSVPSFLRPSDTFLRRHIGPDGTEVADMLKVLGVSSIEELIEQTVPASIRRKDKLNLHEATQSETVMSTLLDKIARQNVVHKSFIGMGYHHNILPPVIKRCLVTNPTWYTAYTPYQAEISQGRLESLLNYQTMVVELTGMEIANASLLDEATAGAEAMTMVFRSTGAKPTKNVFLVSDRTHPQIIEVMKTRAEPIGMKLIVGDHHDFNFSKQSVCGALVQYPDTTGTLEDFRGVADALHAHGAQLVVSSDPLALTLATPPGEFGADVVFGTTQRFGVPMGFGGPHAAFFATRKENMRRMPGRIIGISIDERGDRALRMALQTREQHIRKDKATSNVCTSQALLANIAAMYAIYHGPEGLKDIARRVHGLAQRFQRGIESMGYTTINGENFFDTLTVDIAPVSTDVMVEIMRSRQMNIRSMGPTMVGVAFDETHTVADVDTLLEGFALARYGQPVKVDPSELSKNVTGEMPAAFARKSSFMTQQIFNLIQTETEMMRYMKYLENKDLALNTSMISLGSCTMKLNPASSMEPILWNEFANMHPFSPPEQTKGYRQMIFELSKYLCTITGFDAVSLQPNSGATGEYTGLLAIRKYQESIGEGHRDVCIIPKSAHGTNPASAVMAGMRIKAIDSDKQGNVDVAQLEAVAKEHSEDLSALMVTYPSTHGVFEEEIVRICQIVHDNGGQVYMDGANMNAQLGLTSPGIIGADVCHLNLHKTFAIPHGGGGPGVGPIGVRKHLAPFLPGHCIVPVGTVERGPQVTGAPWGSAMILPISWMFIAMLGAQGLKASAEMAILNANYMMTRLKPHFNIKFAGAKGRCAHEFILDVEPFKKSCGIVEEDVAKRLMDYGFHAPTMSWPVPSALMIEPTESENQAELDRFCDAMIMIREEIGKIESGEWPQDNNPIKNAPHTQKEVCSSDWNRPYSREVGAFPAPWVHMRGKFWPTVGRVNNPFGEKNLVCSCGDVSDYSN